MADRIFWCNCPGNFTFNSLVLQNILFPIRGLGHLDASHQSWERCLAHSIIDLLPNFSETGKKRIIYLRFNMYHDSTALSISYCVLYALLKECSLASLYRSKLTSCQIQTCVCRLVSCCRLTKKYFCRRWDRLRRNDLFCLRRHFASYALYLLLTRVFLGIKPRLVT